MIPEAYIFHNNKLRLLLFLLSSEPWGEKGTRNSVDHSKMVCSLMCHSVCFSKFGYRTNIETMMLDFPYNSRVMKILVLICACLCP